MLQCNNFDPVSSTNGAAFGEGNRITYSALTNHEMRDYECLTYSIKYVLQGTEHYHLQGKRYPVSQASFLLVNNRQPADVFIHSKKPVTGFCLHLQPQLLHDSFANLTNSDAALLHDPFRQYRMPDLEPLIYSDKENVLGEYLRQIAQHYDAGATAISLNGQEVFHHLAYHLAGVQTKTSRNGQLAVLRSSTKKELLRRLQIAKELMDAQAIESPDIPAIAQQAMLSGSHFFRSFKKVYNVSPYQYLLKRKMESAAQLLAAKKMNATEIALSCGYPDLASFSKAFKKAYGRPPTHP